MANMTKAGLVDLVREKLKDSVKVRREDVATMIAAVLEGVTDTLKKGGKVQIVGFGTFEVRKRSARVGRNPQDPTKTVQIPAKSVPVFKAGKYLRDAVNPAPKKTAKSKSAKATKTAKKAKK